MKKSKLIAMAIGTLMAVSATIAPMAVSATDIPIATSTEDTVKSGKCGENVTWTFDNGVLTISGTGDMYDYNCTEPSYGVGGWPLSRLIRPWDNLTIEKIVFEDGITSVGNCAFGPFDDELTSVEFTDSIVSIGDAAFYCLENAKFSDLPDNLKSIGRLAFAKCYRLPDKLEIPEKVEIIGDGAFTNDINEEYLEQYTEHTFRSIIIPKNVETLCSNSISSRINMDIFFDDTYTGLDPVTGSFIEPLVKILEINSYFTIYGYLGSTAEEYANNNNMTFIQIDVPNDANIDGKVNVADVVAIRRYLLNTEKYSLNQYAIANADVVGDNDGINAQDAVAIQKGILGIAE